jgi:excisionase family DNA binding protein
MQLKMILDASQSGSNALDAIPLETTAPPASPRSEWLTAKEAAEYLRVKTRTLLLWTRQGKVKGYPLSGVRRHVWRYRQSDLDAKLTAPSVRPEKVIE